VGDEGFDQFMRQSHVIKDHHKVILRGSQQVWTENDSQRFRCHMIMLFVVGNSSKKEDQSVSCKIE
jgi:hypothetical protein